MGMFLHALCMTSVALLITLGHCQDVVGDIESDTTPEGFTQSPTRQQEKDSINDPPDSTPESLTQSPTRQQGKGSIDDSPDSTPEVFTQSPTRKQGEGSIGPSDSKAGDSTQSPAREGGKRSIHNPPKVSQSPTTRHQGTGSSHPLATTMGVPQSSTHQHGTGTPTVKVTVNVTTENHQQTEMSTVNNKPVCPKQEPLPLPLVSVTNTTITLNFSSYPTTSYLCVISQREPIQDDSECKPLTDSTVIVKIDGLHPGTLYKISVHSYSNSSGEPQLSDQACSNVQYLTRPNGPVCGSNEAMYITNIPSNTIKVDLSSFTGNRLFCVYVQPTPDKEPKCKPLQDNIAIISGLTPSTLYNFTVYSYINDAKGQQLLSVESCFGEHYTRPKGPVCTSSETKFVTDITSNTIKIDFSSFNGKRFFCVHVQPTPEKEPVCIPLQNKVAIIHSLTPSTLYNFTVYSYINDTEGQQLLSVESCFGKYFTRPTGPDCTSNETKYITYVTSNTIKVILSSYAGNGLFCVNVQPTPEIEPVCKPFQNNVANIRRLSPSTLYNLTVYSYINDTEGHQLLSGKSCSVGEHYTRPGRPVCASNETKYVTDITTTTIKVNLSSFTGNKFLCVKVQPKPEVEPVCKPLQNNIAVIRSLTPSTLYNFTVYSYINDTKGQQLLSVESCSLGEYYTLPNIDCPNLSWNPYAKAIYIPETAVKNIKLLNFTVTSQDNNTISFAVPKQDTFSFHTVSGRTYSVLVVGQGVDGTWTQEPCSINFSTPLPAPDCPGEALEIKSTYMVIKLEFCSFDNGTKSAQVIYNSLPVDVTYLKKVVYLPNLEPGSKVNINIFAVGQNGKKSLPFHIWAFTRPSDPNCSNISYFATNESIEVDPRNLLTDGAKYYNITLGGKPQIKSTEDKYIFNFLLPGKTHNVSMTAIGDGNQTSPNGCHTQLFTRPTDPVCSAIMIQDRTTQSLEINLEQTKTNGTLYYLAEYNISDIKQNASFKNDNGFKNNITGLMSGTEYSFFVFAVSLNEVKSSRSCVVTNFTYPSPPMEITNITTETTKFYIQWSKSQGNVDSYSVNVSCNCSCTPKVAHSGSNTTALVSELTPGTHCGVTIVAISGELQSVPFNSQNIKTNETVPGKVSNVSIMDIQPDGFTLLWNQPNSPNGDLLNYIIRIYSSGSKNTSYHLLTSFSFSNLSPGTCYNVSVAAVNSAGEGVIETRTVYTTEKVPSMVQGLETTNTSSTSINVKWNKPLIPNGVVRKYKVHVQKAKEVEEKSCVQLIEFICKDCQKPCPGAETNTQNENLEAEKDLSIKDASSCQTTLSSNFSTNNVSLIYNVIGLEIYTEYSITVEAYTNKGGGESVTANVTTSTDKPSPPGKPDQINVNIFNASFEYTKPEHQNGIITHQEIEFSHMPYYECLSVEKTTESVRNTSVKPIQDNGIKFLASLEDLKPFWEYSIRVRVKTYAGYSNYSEPLIIRTLPTTPEKVSNITTKDITSRGVILSWIQPCHPNGIIRNYRIEITNTTDTSVIVKNTSQTSFSVTGLLPYRNYVINISTEVKNVEERSLPATSEIFQTLTEAPRQPGNITINKTTASSVRLSWGRPSLKTGPTTYEVLAIDKDNTSLTYTCKTKGFENTSCYIDGLDAYWKYSLVVKVYTENFPPKNTTSEVRTDQSAPGKVTSFNVTQDPNVTVKTNVQIEWGPPKKRDLNGIIQKYFIQFWYPQSKKMIKAYDKNNNTAKIEVEAEKNYTFEIFAMTIENATEKNYSRKSLSINPGAPLPLPPQKIPLIQKGPSVSDDQKQIPVAVSWNALCDERNGKITQWFVIVLKGSTGPAGKFCGTKKDYLDFIKTNYESWKDVYENDNRHSYVASDSWKPDCHQKITIPYTLGSDGECNNARKYCNGYLEPGKTYRMRYARCTKGGCCESEYSSPLTTAPNNVPVIAGSVSGVVLALIVVILVIVFLKRKRKGPFKEENSGESGQANEGFSAVEMTSTVKPPKAVRIADFANYVQKMHADSNLLFSQEYKLLKETCPTHTTKAAEIQVNRIKNRYTNILAYDHSRVKLLPTEDDEGSDYINANYIPGFSSQREYIATQGPLPFTRDEFWRMIWEQNVSIVVMLTQLVERGRRKCDIYWPETTREPVYYGDLVVETESESTLPDYVLRVLSVKLGDSRKTVKHFSYLAWPDMGIPETSESMLKFTKEVRSHLPPPTTNRGPIAVHCSAGVGRTGTFIAVDYLMQHVTSSDVVDIYNFVMKMRNNRPNMVQTEDQYIFIHDCIKDYVNRSDDDSDEENEEGEGDQGNPIYANM